MMPACTGSLRLLGRLAVRLQRPRAASLSAAPILARVADIRTHRVRVSKPRQNPALTQRNMANSHAITAALGAASGHARARHSRLLPGSRAAATVRADLAPALCRSPLSPKRHTPRPVR